MEVIEIEGGVLEDEIVLSKWIFYECVYVGY